MTQGYYTTALSVFLENFPLQEQTCSAIKFYCSDLYSQGLYRAREPTQTDLGSRDKIFLVIEKYLDILHAVPSTLTPEELVEKNVRIVESHHLLSLFYFLMGMQMVPINFNIQLGLYADAEEQLSL